MKLQSSIELVPSCQAVILKKCLDEEVWITHSAQVEVEVSHEEQQTLKPTTTLHNTQQKTMVQPKRKSEQNCCRAAEQSY